MENFIHCPCPICSRAARELATYKLNECAARELEQKRSNEAESMSLKRAPNAVTIRLREQCDTLRVGIKELGRLTLELKDQDIFKCVPDYPDQHGEMKANIMLAYRHLEDARMRITSVYDKKETSGQ